MPHPATELALVAIDRLPPSHDARDPAARAGGPGWFDSSWDLQRGLEVREGWSDDERVHGWLEDFLRTQRAIDRAAAPPLTVELA